MTKSWWLTPGGAKKPVRRSPRTGAEAATTEWADSYGAQYPAVHSALQRAGPKAPAPEATPISALTAFSCPCATISVPWPSASASLAPEQGDICTICCTTLWASIWSITARGMYTEHHSIGQGGKTCAGACNRETMPWAGWQLAINKYTSKWTSDTQKDRS